MDKKRRAKKSQAVAGAAKRKRGVKGNRTGKNITGVFINRIKQLVLMAWKPRVVAVIVVVASVSLLYREANVSQLWPIKSVKIEGEFNYLNKENLRQKTLPVVNGGFVSVNLASVRETLINLPWVEDVSVRRQWPDQILVRVIEKQPVVYWGDNALLSTKGKLFVPANKVSLNMPKLNGPEGQHTMLLKELSRMQAWLVDTGLYIGNMKLDARRSWTLKMTSGIELRLGRKQVHERLHRFVSVYLNNLEAEERKIKHIDMRYTNGFAVAWKEA